VPQRDNSKATVTAEFRRHIERVRNAFWFAHQHQQSKAKVIIGSAYELDDSAGRFDIAILSSVLLHTRLPTEIVHRCAALTEERIVISERAFPGMGGAPIMQLEQKAGSDNLDTWWRFAPELFRELLAVYGFGEQAYTEHKQPYWAGGQWNDIEMYTLSASRSAI
jgi:hypothetical protein